MLNSYLERTFAPCQWDEAHALLIDSRIHDGTPASARLVRCALVASRGSLERMRTAADELRYDYQDVILAAEHVHEGGEWIRIHDFDQPIALP